MLVPCRVPRLSSYVSAFVCRLVLYYFFTGGLCLRVTTSGVEFKASHLVSEECLAAFSAGMMPWYQGDFVCTACK